MNTLNVNDVWKFNGANWRNECNKCCLSCKNKCNNICTDVDFLDGMCLVCRHGDE